MGQLLQDAEASLAAAVEHAQKAATAASQAEQQGALDAESEQQASVLVQQTSAALKRVKVLKEKVMTGRSGVVALSA